MTALVAGLASIAIVGGVSQSLAANSTTITDPVGDAASPAGDISRVTIANDDSGVLTAEIQLAAGVAPDCCTYWIHLDADENASTGGNFGGVPGSGYEYAVWSGYEQPLGRPPTRLLCGLSRWNGTRWQIVASSVSCTFVDASGTARTEFTADQRVARIVFRISRNELGGATGVNLVAESNAAGPGTTGIPRDFAPAAPCNYKIHVGAGTPPRAANACGPPPPAQPPPPPPSGAASLPPPQTFVDTFRRRGETETHAVPLTAASKSVQLVVRWPNRRAGFDVAGFRLTGSSRSGARDLTASLRLKISRKRTGTSVNVRVTRLKPGTLRFRVVAKKLPGPTKVTTRVVQSRRG